MLRISYRVPLLCSLAFAFFATSVADAHAQISSLGWPRLLCHRTANKDAPENTLESLRQAAVLGCDEVEIDIRKTLDGVLVLNHDGVLERLTNGTGTVEERFYEELAALDAGIWMSKRFAGLRVARFVDALRLAREFHIVLMLDIKVASSAPAVLAAIRDEHAEEQVDLSMSAHELQELAPYQTKQPITWLSAPASRKDIAKAHEDGAHVIVNFSATPFDLDLDAMRSAVESGADGLNVDYPLIGSEALGRSVAERARRLIAAAQKADDDGRAMCILRLSKMQMPALRPLYINWLQAGEPHSSRAAALALRALQPAIPAAEVAELFHARTFVARANAAWLFGELGGSAAALRHLLKDPSSQVREEALLAIAKSRGQISVESMLSLLHDESSAVRGAAALALASKAPSITPHILRRQLQHEVKSELPLLQRYQKSQRKMSAQDIDAVMKSFRCQMQMLQALASVHSSAADKAIADIAFHSANEFTQMEETVAAFKMWDRSGDNIVPMIAALQSSNSAIADRAEWALVKIEGQTLPAVRKLLSSADVHVQSRAIRILAWRCDREALDDLEDVVRTSSANRRLATWAIARIKTIPL